MLGKRLPKVAKWQNSAAQSGNTVEKNSSSGRYCLLYCGRTLQA